MFRNRREAGWRLGAALRHLAADPVTVLGLPRGGVPVAYEVSLALHAPLEVLVVRKLGVPFQPELAMGAIGEDGVQVIDDSILAHTGVGPGAVAAVEEAERHALLAAVRRYRHGRPPPRLSRRTAVLVDDGLATGSTALAAVRVARARGAARVVVATPVAATQALSRLHREADDVVALVTPRELGSVGQWYGDFSPVEEDAVIRLLGWARWNVDAGEVAEHAAGAIEHREAVLDPRPTHATGHTRLGT